ncbi:MAG: Non-canonical purine pyrophosphatase [Bacteroidetes bacterium]|jgi:XTP/dITP diphosphohydrolase|nr:Non-canonical purine pyrophosphatase [Bacteroidota bacterium]
MNMSKLLLATRNKHKAEELQAMLNDLGLEVVTLDAYPQVGEILEDAGTIEGNALKKAKEVFGLIGVPAIADDTGLEVFYLNKAPGVYSSRYAGPDATYADNCRKLLGSMKGVPPRRRGAQFRCVLAFVAPGMAPILEEGICRGSITEEPHGEGGFGYDPVFLPDGYTQTFAEMLPDVKNTISHRSVALQKMKDTLKSHLKSL